MFFYVTAVISEDPECRVDADCRSMHACIGDTCQNPCRISNPCRPGQECVVEDTLPVRTMACICPDGFYIGNNGECVQGTLLQCECICGCISKAFVLQLLLYLSVLFMLIVATLNSVTQVLALMLVASSNVARMRSARPEIIAFHVLVHLVIQEMLELHAIQVSVLCFWPLLNVFAYALHFQSLPIPWMSLLAVAQILSVLIMLPASTKHVATHVLNLILALPMLSARLFITHQSVLALQGTLVTHKLSANCHVSNHAFYSLQAY